MLFDHLYYQIQEMKTRFFISCWWMSNSMVMHFMWTFQGQIIVKNLNIKHSYKKNSKRNHWSRDQMVVISNGENFLKFKYIVRSLGFWHAWYDYLLVCLILANTCTLQFSNCDWTIYVESVVDFSEKWLLTYNRCIKGLKLIWVRENQN